MFLHALAQRLIVFDRGQVNVFEGTYQSFLDKGGWEGEVGALGAAHSERSDAPPEPQISRKELRQKRSALINERSRQLKPVKKAIAAAEAVIEAEEQRLAQLNADMVQASQDQEGARIAQLSPAIHESQHAIDRQFEALEALYDKKERLQQRFDDKLNESGLNDSQ
jgi:ATP-binding cassette, subfamily F, member 3